MLLPPAVSARLAGAPGTAEPLPVERDPAAGAPPFRFAARPVRFPRDHEFFEGARVHLSRGRLLPGVCRPGGLPAPLPCDARERLLPLQSCLPLQPLAGGPHPGVARLTLPDPGGEAGHVQLCQELRQACQPEPRRMMGTPWKSARNPLCRLPVGGPTATGFLLPSALARVHLEGFKAPRRETNTADGYGKRTRTRCLGRQVGDRTLWVIVSTGAFLLLLL
ncbi:zinc finger protein 511 isoform X7 [Castor canadensis]|uniref:Zinc finger protein 511 isoform X7 n=1 Tax=Castor canadensis TaxID=51338 RepID=A0AC58MXH0_CASCN